MNKRSVAASLKHPAGNEISLHYPDALDYLVYAYLQQADDYKARQVLKDLSNLVGPFQTHIAASYSFTAIPERFALERQQWSEAADLQTRLPNDYPIEKFPAMEAITYFARALGAARSANLKMANQTLEKLTEFHKKIKTTSGYWAKQIEIQRKSVMAWNTYQEGRKNEALKVMQKAVKLEPLTEKHPVTPGEILPAHELYADMLLDMGRYSEAQTEYEKVLKRSPMLDHTFKLHAADGAFAGAVDSALLYQQSAAKAGIKMQVVKEPSDGYWSNVWMKKPWSMSYWSGRPTVDLMFTTAYAADANWNETYWKNERFNKLLIEARAELDEKKRTQMYFEMQQITRDEGATVVPFFSNIVVVASDKIGYENFGAGLDLDDARGPERWWFKS